MGKLSAGISEKGMVKGLLIALLESVCALMDSAQVSAEKAMAMLRISDEDRASLKVLLEITNQK